MGQDSKIEWTDHTWNPWVGCTKLSPACANCYMFDGMKRTGNDPTDVRKTVMKPLPLRKDRQKNFKLKPGEKVFTCSWSDWFHEDADKWRPEAWDIIRQRPDVTFQIVTKRIDRAAGCLPPDWGDGWPNCWIIVTAENQEWLDRRRDLLMELPARVRGLSIEPMLGPICDVVSIDEPSVDWVIVGGESGHGARPVHPAWVRSIRDQCQAAGVPFFFKQWGEWIPASQQTRSIEFPDIVADGANGCPQNGWPESHVFDWKWQQGEFHSYRCGKKAAGRMLDGREWSEFPKGGAT